MHQRLDSHSLRVAGEDMEHVAANECACKAESNILFIVTTQSLPAHLNQHLVGTSWLLLETSQQLKHLVASTSFSFFLWMYCLCTCMYVYTVGLRESPFQSCLCPVHVAELTKKVDFDFVLTSSGLIFSLCCNDVKCTPGCGQYTVTSLLGVGTGATKPTAYRNRLWIREGSETLKLKINSKELSCKNR